MQKGFLFGGKSSNKKKSPEQQKLKSSNTLEVPDKPKHFLNIEKEQQEKKQSSFMFDEVQEAMKVGAAFSENKGPSQKFNCSSNRVAMDQGIN